MVGLEPLQGSIAAFGDRHTVAHLTQDIKQNLNIRGIIIHDENGAKRGSGFHRHKSIPQCDGWMSEWVNISRPESP